MPQFVEKQLEPLPLRAFRIQRTVDALRHMARAEHIGKVVIQAAPTATRPTGDSRSAKTARTWSPAAWAAWA